MSRTRVRYRCSECGGEAARWLGRCPACGAWNSLGEDHRPVTRAGAVTTAERPVPIAAVSPSVGAGIATGVEELDRVLGGGLVAGSVTLVGGEPGIGKSTLVLQALGSMAAAGLTVLLVAAEESVQQVRLRAERLGVLHDRLLVVAETSLPAVFAHVDDAQPTVVAVDSIQTLLDPDLTGAAGSVVQVRECAQRLVRFAKERNVITLLVGHVTKEGTLAGPRVLEHIVDTVLSFEGDRHHALRLLQVMKHRFGSTQELGLFEMTERGLLGVPDPSALFLTDRRPGASGSVVAPVLEGARPMLVELQALVAASYAPGAAAFGAGPRRKPVLAAARGARTAGPAAAQPVRCLRQRGRRSPRHGGRRRSRDRAGGGERTGTTSRFRRRPWSWVRSGWGARCVRSPTPPDGSPRPPGSASTARSSRTRRPTSPACT